MLSESKMESIRLDNFNVIAVIPSYLDTDRLVQVLSRFRNKEVNEICVVIDCPTQHELAKIKKATDNTKVPVTIIINKEVKGVGYAIKRGLKYARHKGSDIVVIMAGNNKDNPAEIPRLLTPILNENYDYVQGSRFLPGGKPVKTPFMRKIFSRLFPFIWTLLTRVRCTDVTNGFRAYKMNFLEDKRINVMQDWLDRYQLEYYIHYKMLTLGYKFKEVPVSKVYPYRNKGGYSRISPARDWWSIAGPLIYLKLGIKS